MSSLRRSFSVLTRFAAAAPVLAFTLLLIVCNQKASAQVLFGSIVGNVTDASGSDVPGATIKIIETSTGESRSVQTNDAGVYNLTTVTGGTYQIEIAKTGFRSFVASSVLLNQNNVVRVDAQLELGPRPTGLRPPRSRRRSRWARPWSGISRSFFGAPRRFHGYPVD